MAWGKSHTGSEQQSDRESNDPHPHWESNWNYWKGVEKLEAAQRKFKRLQGTKMRPIETASPAYTVSGVNKLPDGTFEVPTCLTFSWSDRAHRNIGFPISFHQDWADFRKEIDSLIVQREHDKYFRKRVAEITAQEMMQ